MMSSTTATAAVLTGPPLHESIHTMQYPIYLDHNATTPVAPEVVDAMLPFLREHHGNPSSSHAYGRRAAEAVAEARARVAALIGARPAEIVFTGSATEANNLALLGVAQANGGAGRHLVTSCIEHPAVAAPAAQLGRQGWGLSELPVDGFGRASVQDLEAALRPQTVLVSVIHAHNEVGSLQPIRDMAELTRRAGILLHTDAAQSVGKIPVDVDLLGVDLLTLAGHKFQAPKGIGALYVRSGTSIRPIVHGAGQEGGLRPGTENVAAIVGLGAAAALAQDRLQAAGSRLRELGDRLHAGLASAIPGLTLNGHPVHRLPNTLHLSFPGVSGVELLREAGEAVAASLGSACHAGQEVAGGVLAAMGVDAARARGAVRLSVGWTTSLEDISSATDALVSAWRRLGAGGACAR